MATTLCSALALSCQLLIGIPDDDLSVALPDAGGDEPTTIPGAPDANQNCGASLPSRPDGGDAGGEGTYFFGLKTVALGGKSASDGFNLDNACTCTKTAGDEARATCRARTDAGGCDVDGGIDNGFFPFTQGYTGLLIKDFNEGIAKTYNCGRENLIFVLQNYNGQADDDFVFLIGVRSHGILEDRDGGTGSGGCAPYFPAKFDGEDRWVIDPLLVGERGIPAISSPRGYVKDYKLVVDGREPEQPQRDLLIPGVGTPPVSLKQPMLVANLARVDGGIELTSGVMSGRANLAEMLKSLGSSFGDGNGKPYCEGTGWDTVKDNLCGAADLATSSAKDFSTDACDALSLVVSFEATRVQFRSETEKASSRVDVCDAGSLRCPGGP